VTAASVITLLVFPLGWIYYLPLMLGPAAATWRNTGLNRLALLLFAVPLPLMNPLFTSPLVVRIFGNLYAYALILTWLAASRTVSRPRLREQSQDHVERLTGAAASQSSRSQS
jgi:hypothetical protein